MENIKDKLIFAVFAAIFLVVCLYISQSLQDIWSVFKPIGY